MKVPFNVQADKAWAEQYKVPLYQILRDIAEPSGVDPHYTMSRYGTNVSEPPLHNDKVRY